MKKLLKTLSEAHGVPGSEGDVRDIMKRELKKTCKIETDNLGNLIAKKGSGKKKVMLAAHMDEIGLMVKHVSEKGFIYFTPLGGFFDQTLVSQRVIIHTAKKKKVSGVIGTRPPHLMKEDERKKVIEAKDMFIDAGFKSAKEAAKARVGIGDYITIERDFQELGGDLVTGKAFDDRIGCLILIEVMKKLKSKYTVYGVGTVQEEVGLKGARTSAYKINPDFAIAIDVIPSGDYPGIKEEESPAKIGEGPVIEIADARGRGLITHPKIKEMLIKAAKKKRIKHQLSVGEGGTTDATAIHLTREGIPSGVVSVPIRYVHSPVEVANTKDIKAAIDLIIASLS
jgi:endoglucanase